MGIQNSDHYFLKGGGEMGKLIREKDWSKTSLGDPANWPQSLRTMVAVMLDNPFGMYIAWGAEYTQIYNDGYRPILGATKHPQALGISTRETFSEIWHIIESMFDGVMKGTAVGFPDLMLPLDRNGFVEECYFDFAYSPIRKDDGEVGGVLVTVVETTNKKKAEEALKESEARFRTIADDAPVFIFLAGENAEVEYLNKTWREYTGISTNDYKGRVWAEITHIDDIEPATKIYMDGFNKRESCSFENRQKGIDGIYRTIFWKATPRFSLNGQFIGMMGVGLDIHERKRSEEKLRESEQRLRLANEASGVAVWEWNVITGQIKWDNEMFRIYGVTPTVDNLVDYTSWSTAVVPEELAQQENILQNTVKNKGQSSRSFNIKRASDGELRHIEAIEIVRTNAAGQAEWVVGTNLDITEKVEARKKVEDSEERFQAAVKAVQGILWTNNARGEMEGEQSGWALLTGQTYEEYQGYGWAKAVHPDDEQSTVDAWNEAVQERKTFIFEHRVMTKDGQWRDFSIRAIPLSNADGTLRQWVGVHTDITDIKQAAKALKANEEKLTIVIEASELGTWELNLKTIEVTYSKKYLEILGGYKEDIKLTHAQLLQHLHPDDLIVREKAFKEAIITGYLHYEARLIWNDKSIHWMEGKGKVFYDDENKPLKLIGTLRDITEEKNHEEELKKSEEQFSTLADNMENLAWLADGEGWIYWYNKRWIEYTGLSLEEMQGWGWQKVHHPDHVERILEITKKIWHINETFELTFPLRRHDGEYRWFLTRGYPVTNEEGKIIRWIGTNTDIDEQKKAEEQFKALADQAPMWVWLTDKEVNMLYTNPEVLKFIGIAHYTEFTGNMWEQKVHPEDIGMVYHSFGEAVSSQQSFSFEFRVLNASTQQYEWFYIKAVPRLESGEFTGFIGTGININEQRLTLSQLEYRKALLEAHNESSLDGILLVDTKGKILSCNHRFEEIWNMQQQIVEDKDDEAALAFALTQLVNPGQFMERVRWMYENPDKISIDELEFKDGKIIERHGYHVAAADGNYYGCSWMFRDITEQRKYERAVKESEEKFRLLADSMPQHIWTSDTEGNLNYYNQSVLDYSGLTLEQINKDGWIQIVHPDDREENIKQWVNAVSTGKDFLFEHRFRRHDGEYRWQLSRALPQRNANGKIQMWVGTSTDIQEQKTFTQELELQVSERTKELEASNAELQKINKELQTFAYISSHDLQEPLRKIQTFSTQIIEKEFQNLSESGKDKFQRMQNAAHRMQTLIDDLLSYSRTTTQEGKFEKANLNTILEEVKEDLKEELQLKHATIEANEMCEANIIPFQFRQLLFNLVNNSLKFSKSYEPPHIKIKSEIAEGTKLNNQMLASEIKYCHISVSDNGIGFEQQYSEKIFEVFQRLHGKNEYEGTGIGLSIVKRIVENHHGVITAKGELNKGVVFDIYLPAT